MDGIQYVNNEGVPLNSSGMPNVFVNNFYKNKRRNVDGTIVQVNRGNPNNVHVNINNTLSLHTSKKTKMLLITNCVLSAICLTISGSIVVYVTIQMHIINNHIDTINGRLNIQTDSNGNRTEQSHLRSHPRFALKDDQEPILETSSKHDSHPNDMFNIDSNENSLNRHPAIKHQPPQVLVKELQVAQFNGAAREINLATKSIVGPWIRDVNASSKNSENLVTLKDNFFEIQQEGIYFIYAQLAYLSHMPGSFYVLAHPPDGEGWLITTCATGDDSTAQDLDKTQISCMVQAVARLNKGVTVNMALREYDRILWLRPGYSYFGFIKLSS